MTAAPLGTDSNQNHEVIAAGMSGKLGRRSAGVQGRADTQLMSLFFAQENQGSLLPRPPFFIALSLLWSPPVLSLSPFSPYSPVFSLPPSQVP